MKMSYRTPLTFLLVGALLVAGSLGCVRTSKYELARKDAEQARQQARDLLVTQQQMQQRIQELEATLESWRTQLVRTEQDWKEVRDSLIRTRIHKELQRQGAGDGLFRLESEKGDSKREARLRTEPPSSEIQHRLKSLRDLLGEIEALLERS